VSAGSFFTNPIVTADFARQLADDAPRWPLEPSDADFARMVPREYVSLLDEPMPIVASPDLVKLSAAWLIQHAGLKRGFALPGSKAQISDKHTLAIVNRGGSSGEEVAELARFIQSRVMSEYGVLLRPEPILLGLSLD